MLSCIIFLIILYREIIGWRGVSVCSCLQWQIWHFWGHWHLDVAHAPFVVTGTMKEASEILPSEEVLQHWLPSLYMYILYIYLSYIYI